MASVICYFFCQKSFSLHDIIVSEKMVEFITYIRRSTMQWLKVFLAGLVEVIWVTGLNKADSFFAWLVVAIFIILSFYLVIAACNTLPVGTVYAVFVGMGTIGTVLVDILFFHEPFSLIKIILIALLIIGIIGLKLTTNEGEA